MQLSDYIYAASRIIYPDHCCLCDNDLIKGEKHICATCSFDLPYISANENEVTKLSQLFRGRIPVERVYSLFRYQKGNQVQTILHHIKYKSRPKMATHYGSMLGNLISDQSFDAIVPVPLHPKKERKRGFNQSLAIAIGISESCGKPVDTKIIRRQEHNASQTGFSKYDRFENVRSIFEIKNPSLIKGKHFLLVDDVLTTGATIESCAAEFFYAADCKISIATLAARL